MFYLFSTIFPLKDYKVSYQLKLNKGYGPILIEEDGDEMV
jgi:hypothetical protein